MSAPATQVVLAFGADAEPAILSDAEPRGIPPDPRIIAGAAGCAAGVVRQLGTLQDLQGDSPTLLRAIGSLNDLAEIKLLWQQAGGSAL
jgi:hypothetical protein